MKMNPIVCIRIYYDPINGPDGCIPMADLQFLDGTVNTIQWNSDTRNLYLDYITSYTFIYDDRQKPDIRSIFPKFYNSNFKEVVSRINIDNVHNGTYYFIDLMSMKIDGHTAMYDVYDMDMNMIGVYGAYCFREVFNNEE